MDAKVALAISEERESKLDVTSPDRITEELKRIDNQTAHFFRRAGDLEARSQALHGTIASLQTEKRELQAFCSQLKEASEISNSKQREDRLEEIRKEFNLRRELSDALTLYVEDPSAREFLIQILTIKDFRLIKAGLLAAVDNNEMADSILRKNISLMEIFVKDPVSFSQYIVGLFVRQSQIKSAYLDGGKESKEFKKLTQAPLNQAA